MLKIHSFLQRIRKPINRFLPNHIGKYKMQLAVVAYMLVTVLFILSPDYIYNASKNDDKAYANATGLSRTASDIVEETANEAIIRTNQKEPDSNLILCDLTTDGSPLKFMAAEKTSIISNETIKNSKADSVQIGADANDKADSGSTDKNEIRDTEKAAEEKVIKTLKEKDEAVEEQKTVKTKATVTTKVTEKKANIEKQKAKKNVINLSDSEIEILQRIVEAEATGEDVKGKILVANVILNRVNNKEFPDTVKGVVFQKDGSTYQFSPIKDGRYWSVKISKATVKAVEKVMQGEDYSQGALYFSARSRADKNSMSWFDNHLNYLFRYGGHEFFK